CVSIDDDNLDVGQRSHLGEQIVHTAQFRNEVDDVLETVAPLIQELLSECADSLHIEVLVIEVLRQRMLSTEFPQVGRLRVHVSDEIQKHAIKVAPHLAECEVVLEQEHHV